MESKLSHDVVFVQDELQLKVVAPLRAPDHTLVSRRLEMPEAGSSFKVAAGLRGKHVYTFSIPR